MQSGYIYALKNRSFGDYVIKIGMTTREPYIRAREIYCGASGVPEPFDVAFACWVSDCKVAETKIHERLKTYKINNKREFFLIQIEVAKMVILDVCQEVEQLFDCSVQNPIVIDSQALDDLDSPLEHSDTNDSFKVVELSLEQVYKLKFSSPGTSLLSSDMKKRIEVFTAIFTNVFPRAIEDWLIDFSRDKNPEIEICIWENVAKAFLKIDQVRYLNEEQKKEAFYLLCFRSMMSSSKVLESFKLKTFCKKAAKEILRGYEANPIPISISAYGLNNQSRYSDHLSL